MTSLICPDESCPANAQRIDIYVNGNLVQMWIARLGEMYVSIDGQLCFEKKQDAIDLAQRYKDKYVEC